MPVLPDLRPTIAESMMALSLPETDPLAFNRMQAGAQTLRWCAEREGTEEDAARLFDEQQICDLEDRLDKIGGILTIWVGDGMRKPAKFRDRLAAILDR